MKSYLRITSPWSQLVLFLGLLLASVLIGSFVGAGFLMAKGLVSLDQKSFDFNNPKLIDALKSIQLIYTIIGFLLPALVYAWITFKYKPLYFLGFRASQKFNFYLFAVILMIISFPLASWLGELNEHIPLAKWMVDAEKEAGKQMDAFLKTTSTKDVIVNLLIIGLIPAICEEACFRGVLQRIFIQIVKNPWIGIVLSAIFFSAFHMQFEGFLPRMFLGILLGALYWYSGSLWVSITAHFFNNASQLILILYYPKLADENPSIPFYAAIASALIVWGILLLIQRQSKSNYQAVYEFENGENAGM
jgi:membrane protease YdiL (CAAX protease family)